MENKTNISPEKLIGILENHIRIQARLELGYVCRNRGCVREYIYRKIKLLEKSRGELEKEIGLPKDIIYTILNEKDIRMDEFEYMAKEDKDVAENERDYVRMMLGESNEQRH